MATEHRTDLIPSPPIQTKVYPLLVMAGFFIVLALYTISQALRFQHGRIAAMARGAE